MNIQPAPTRIPALETDNSGVFNRIWVRWFDALKSGIEGLRTNGNALTTDHRQLTYLNSTDYSHLTAVNATDLTDGGVTTLHSHASDPAATTDHRQLTYLNSTDYSHLTAVNATDLTDGGVTTLHSHASGHAAATVADTATVDMSITGQQISAVTIGLTDTITFVE